MYDRMRAYIFAHTYSELRLSLSSHVETSASGTKATVPNDVTVKDTSSRPVSTDLVMHPLDNEGNGHRYGCAHISDVSESLLAELDALNAQGVDSS